MKNNRGITLVALVITIIILLILAGISIVQLTESGIFKKARKAEEKTKESQNLENSILKDYENTMNEYMTTEKKKPQIIVNIENATSVSIKVNILVNDEENIIPQDSQYSYYIKSSQEEKYPEIPSYIGTNKQYTFEGLTQGTNYNIKVTVKDKNNNIIEGTNTNSNTIKIQHLDSLNYSKNYSYYLYFRYNGSEYFFLSNNKMYAMRHYADDNTKKYFQMPCHYKPVNSISGMYYKYSDGKWNTIKNNENIILNITNQGTEGKTEWSWFENSAFEYIYCNYEMILYNNITSGTISEYKKIILQDIGAL